MDSREYLASVGLHQRLGLRNTASDPLQVWNLAGEYVLQAAVGKDTQQLGKLASATEKILDAHPTSAYEHLYQPQEAPGEMLENYLLSPEPIDPEDVRKMTKGIKVSLEAFQAVNASTFLKNKIESNFGGELTYRFNARTLQEMAMVLHSFAVGLQRNQTATDGVFDFTVNDKPLPAWHKDPFINSAINELHSQLLITDTLFGLVGMCADKELTFTPLLSGETTALAADTPAPRSLATDILLIHESAQSMIPIQVRSQARLRTPRYASKIVLVDSTVLGVNNPVTTIEHVDGHAQTGYKNFVTAGSIARKACIEATRKHPRHLHQLPSARAVSERLYAHIAQNPHHMLG